LRSSTNSAGMSKETFGMMHASDNHK